MGARQLHHVSETVLGVDGFREDDVRPGDGVHHPEGVEDLGERRRQQVQSSRLDSVAVVAAAASSLIRPVAVELTSEFLGSNGYNVVAPGYADTAMVSAVRPACSTFLRASSSSDPAGIRCRTAPT